MLLPVYFDDNDIPIACHGDELNIGLFDDVDVRVTANFLTIIHNNVVVIGGIGGNSSIGGKTINSDVGEHVSLIKA